MKVKQRQYSLKTTYNYNQGYLDSVYSHLYDLLKVSLETVWSPFV